MPPAGRGRVLVTTQNQHWPPNEALDVPVLDLEMAVNFLVDRTGDPDRVAARELARQLGGLPLALEQAAAYMRATGDGFADYLTWFRQRRADILARGKPVGYDKTVATTFALAFDRLQQANPGAVGLLRLFAFCASEAIPLELLDQPQPELVKRLSPEVKALLLPLLEDSLAARDAIVALREHSLISLLTRGLVSMHRLVQAVAIDQIPSSTAAEWRQAASLLIRVDLTAKIQPLILKLEEHIQKLQEQTEHIMLSPAADESDVAEAHDSTVKLFSLIVDQVLPSRELIRQWTAVSSSVTDLDSAFNRLRQSGQDALVAIDVYAKTLGNERRQRQTERRSTRRYAADQQSLQRLRYGVTAEFNKLIAAIKGFIRVVS